ncbi:MAG TPA: alpha,alpha-trehalase TreF [Chitinophagaceae bacterium]|nr:alpha,alpha-trehalase TreF [Chitinophagaceae bacterium]
MASIEIYELHPLFEEIQFQRVFPDGKTFVDCLPVYPLEEINDKFLKLKNAANFNHREFILQHFKPPVPHSTGYASDRAKTVEENIELLWDILTRNPDKAAGSLVPLPYPYIVPGGRFGEIYYWDSYFTMLGLAASGKTGMIENMINNFSWLIDRFGYIPNGNRSYFIGRSQPPFYSLMIKLLADAIGEQAWLRYLPQLVKEYDFWMKGQDALQTNGSANYHLVRMPGGEWLNRYWDQSDTARPESYREDMELARRSAQSPATLFRHLRAGAESGWDYSYRWFKDEQDFSTIHTTDIVPVDLNCLLWHLEKTIALAYRYANHLPGAEAYETRAENRKQAIDKYCWNPALNFYTDYDFAEQQPKPVLTLAGLSPLFFGLANEQQAAAVAQLVQEKFLCDGGVVATLRITGQQWDAPNGWAPLQWMTIVGLEKYGYKELAITIAKRWINLNREVFKRTGKLMEKYNVMNTTLEAGGGEYEGQDGFGWTNGVYLALTKKYGDTI